MDALEEIWNEIGLEDEEMKIRNDKFLQHVSELYADMLDETKGHKYVIEKEILKHMEQLNTLSTELQCNISLPSDETPLLSTRRCLEQKIEK